VLRKHTLPYHRPENLAEHTWGVIHILLSIYPNAPAELLKVALYHDIGEYRSGDMPGDFKAAHPEVRDVTEAFEEESARRVLPEHLHSSLTPTPEDAFLLKICDKIEFAFSCYHEWMLGNRYAVEPMGRTLDHARLAISSSDAIFTGLPESVRANIMNLLNEASRLHKEVRDASNGYSEIQHASE
jgi:5'-deoxynucleotidase YfbR-like HD superfamily hydrolase